MKSLRLDRICLLAAGLVACAVPSNAQPAMSRGQQFLPINSAECLKRAMQALRNVGFSASTAGNFAQGFRETSGAYIICNDLTGGTVVNIVVASSTNDANVPGQLRQLLQAQMQQPGTPPPPPPPPPPGGGSLSGNWQFSGNWPFDSLDHAQPLILQEDGSGRLSGANAVRYVYIPTDPQSMWECAASQHSGNQAIICLHPSNWNSSITLTGTVNGSTISGTAKHYNDVVNFTMTRVSGGAPAKVIPIGAAKYIGCFKDTNNPLDLDGFLTHGPSNTPEQCIQTCRQKGFAYAGVQNGQSCLCGNTYGRYGQAANCNIKCTGSSSEICGGAYANSVFSTGVVH